MSPYRVIAISCLLLTCLISPWCFGSVQVPVQVGLWVLLAMGIAATAADQVSTPAEPSRVPWLFWVACGAVVVGGLQLIPLPLSMLAACSPRAAELWQVPRDLSFAPISLHPTETRYHLTLLLGGLAGIWIADRCLTTDRARRVFLTAVLINGVLLAAVGVAHYLTASESGVILWYRKLTQGGRPFASFVNRNHAAGYLNLCLAAGFGLVLWQGLARPRGNGGPESPISRWGPAVGTAVVFLGVLATLSRSAVLGLAGGMALLMGVVLIKRVKGVAVIPLLILAVAATALMGTERGAMLVDRFHRVSTEDVQGVGSRLEHWQDALRGVPDFLTTGSGLGTYRFIYRRYQDSFQEGWYYHAENQYLEALLEGGLIGLGLLCGCLLVAACGLWLLLRRAESPVALALGVTGGFALVSQALQSCFDFGLYLPSNSILFASLLGLSLRAADEVGAAPSPSQPRRLSLTVTLVLLSLLCWGTYELTRRARVEARIAAAKKIEPLPDADPQRVERALRGLRALDDPAAARAAGRLLTIRYRLEAQEELTRAGLSVGEAWTLTSPMVVFRRFHQALEDPARLAAWRTHPTLNRYLRPAADAFERALAGCPLIPEVQISLAQIAGLRTDWTPEWEEQLLVTAVSMGPADPDVLFNAGLMDLQAGRVEVGLRRWRQSLERSARYAAEMAELGFQWASDDEVFASMIPTSPRGIVTIAAALDPRVYARQRQQLASLAEQRLTAGEDAESHHLRSAIAMLRGQTAQQIEHLRQAVQAAPRNLEWRYELAQQLSSQGAWDEARDHARVCAQLAPHRAKFVELHKRIMQTILTTPTN